MIRGGSDKTFEKQLNRLSGPEIAPFGTLAISGYCNMSAYSGLFDTFLGYVNGVDNRLGFPGIPRTITGRFVLTPGLYWGAEDVEDDGEPFEEKMGRLTRNLGEQFVESERLSKEISKNLKGLGYDL